MTASLRILSSKADSNTCESFTRSGLKLESVHQESPCSDVFRKRATKPLLNQRQRQKHLTWAVEKKNWTVAQWSKVLFQMKVNFAFHLEIKVPESGGRVKRHRIHNPFHTEIPENTRVMCSGICSRIVRFAAFTLPVIFRNMCVHSHTTRKDT